MNGEWNEREKISTEGEDRKRERGMNGEGKERERIGGPGI